MLEASDAVGGISRTVERDGWRFDIGGHRFFTKVPEVEAFWHEVLPDEDFLMRPRLSRILYRGKLFDYPLKPFNALLGLGMLEAVRCVLSYALVRVRPPKDQTNFEGWVAARFGWRLYRIFFKTYTEKVWGVPATDIQADWAAQRIKNLSLLNADHLGVRPRQGQDQITTLIEEFQYPRLGPGMMWERAATWSIGPAARSACSARSPASSTPAAARAPSCWRTGERLPASRGRVLHAAARAGPRDGPARARRRAAGRRRAALPRLPHRRARRAGSAGFPDNWIYIHSPASASAACRTSAPGRR